jgi:hypothetical protein
MSLLPGLEDSPFWGSQPKSPPSLGGSFYMSVERLGYHPLLGALNQKTLLTSEDLSMSVERLEDSPLLGALNQKTLLTSEDLSMSVERLELSTNGLKGRCSTVELHARDATFYHAHPDASTNRER